MTAGGGQGMGGATMRLQRVSLELILEPGPLLDPIEKALAQHGSPLRWAITACTALPGGQRWIRLEAMALHGAP
ncbi:hypothetical protein [Candidatus Synechococcus spongiarum]|uniref:hypothetical protein n=1 Tax=Candidatus Synechococcus spongiarum TaxID=431041 RepID=UPI001268118A|nr:hypothetical protein [Candidatus Synechococcus spongiarum]